MIPSVDIQKADGSTGVVKPSSEGILAIIAPAEKGTQNQPASYLRKDLALADFGYGPLVEDAAYDMDVSKKPVVLIRGAASTAGSNGTVAHSGAGTSVVTATGVPLDDFDAYLEIVTGGTIGTAGITYRTSLDGGKTKSAVTALGTANSVTIPNSGVAFAFGAGTVLAGQTESYAAKGPRMTNADLVAALEALRTYGGAWDALLVAADADATMIATVDLWLRAREGEGKYKTALLNIRPKNAGETEAAYATAAAAVVASSSSVSIVVGADAGDVVSSLRGVRMKRPVALGIAARGMEKDISTDAAFVNDGPIAGFQITDDRQNPKHHDEALFPGLDDLRLATLRSFDGRAGAFVNNPNLLSPSGSDYVYWQHARVMNRACEIAFQILTGRLSQGVRKDVASGYILEEDAQEIEGLVQAELDKQLVTPGRVSGAKFVLSRTDNLTSNQGATIHCDLQVSALSYIKKFAVVSRFVKTIAVAA